MFASITSIIERYAKKQGTDYALLLNGGWGCGKTYYVTHELIPHLKTIGLRPIYISLNGVKTSADVALRITVDCLTRDRANKFAGVMTRVLSGETLSVFGESIWARLGIGAASVLPKGWKRNIDVSAENDVLIVDDVERISQQADLLSVIGWLHEVYAKNSFHVVFIADENHISGIAKFGECKEKYIRQTIDFAELSKDRLEEFARGYCKDYVSLHSAIEARYLEFVGKKKIVNLRVVSMMLDCVREVCEALGPEMGRKYAEFIFACIAPLVHAQSEGRLSSNDKDDYAGLTRLDGIRYFFREDEKRGKATQEERRIFEFADEYDEVSPGGRYILVKAIFKYVVTGILDAEGIRSEIEELFEKKERPEHVAYTTLREYWLLEEEELLAAAKRVVEYLRQGAYTLEEVLQIRTALTNVMKDAYLDAWPFPESCEQMFTQFVDERLKRDGVSWENVQSFSLQAEHFNPGDEVAMSLVRRIKEHYQKQIANENNERMRKFISALQSRNQTVADTCLRRENSNWALFSELDHAGVIGDIPKLPTWGLMYLQNEARRHIIRVSNSGDFDFRELIPMEKIVEQLKLCLNTDGVRVCRKARVKELMQTLESACKHVASTMSEQTRQEYVQWLGEDAAKAILGRYGVTLRSV